MHLSPAFVYLAIISIGATVVESAPVALERRLVNANGGNSIVTLSHAHHGNLVEAKADTTGHRKDVLDVDVNLCKQNLLRGIVDIRCGGAKGKGINGHGSPSKLLSSSIVKGTTVKVGGNPLSGERAPVNVALGTPPPGAQSNTSGGSEDHSQSSASNSSKKNKPKKNHSSSQNENGDHKQSHGKSPRKGGKKGGQDQHSSKNASDGSLASASVKPLSAQASTQDASRQPSLASVNVDPSGLLGASAFQAVQSSSQDPHQAIDATYAATAAHSHPNVGDSHAHSSTTNIDGAANGGSVDCSSKGGLLGLSSLNINSCNGGNGGKNYVGGSSADDHRQSLLGGLLHRRDSISDSPTRADPRPPHEQDGVQIAGDSSKRSILEVDLDDDHQDESLARRTRLPLSTGAIAQNTHQGKKGLVSTSDRTPQPRAMTKRQGNDDSEFVHGFDKTRSDDERTSDVPDHMTSERRQVDDGEEEQYPTEGFMQKRQEVDVSTMAMKRQENDDSEYDHGHADDHLNNKQMPDVPDHMTSERRQVDDGEEEQYPAEGFMQKRQDVEAPLNTPNESSMMMKRRQMDDGKDDPYPSQGFMQWRQDAKAPWNAPAASSMMMKRRQLDAGREVQHQSESWKQKRKDEDASNYGPDDVDFHKRQDESQAASGALTSLLSQLVPGLLKRDQAGLPMDDTAVGIQRFKKRGSLPFILSGVLLGSGGDHSGKGLDRRAEEEKGIFWTSSQN